MNLNLNYQKSALLSMLNFIIQHSLCKTRKIICMPIKRNDILLPKGFRCKKSNADISDDLSERVLPDRPLKPLPAATVGRSYHKNCRPPPVLDGTRGRTYNKIINRICRACAPCLFAAGGKPAKPSGRRVGMGESAVWAPRFLHSARKGAPLWQHYCTRGTAACA